MVATITPQELSDRLKQDGTKLLDVRTPAEYREAHVRGAVNLPLDRLSAEAAPSAETVLVICQRGSRGKQACEKLTAAGLSNVVNVEGGTLACIEAGLPIERGKKTISLERQVRIAAGSLVVVGAALGAFVHPAWLGLSAFVGAGLVFAGVTDTCGMAMMLARMPWNQAGGENRTAT
ncbi:Inner membrane protein YgaP [Pseudobythopirellula maris]|uniref:Inner membrane protein YgaP n=1 Tax=Pseudobythopirellula maris TaxID=2527991 RepID=A0A5C5ZMJ0_9BACT|nr:rhodanese-like domain-containing protein [Pseudobythopirellula maris]TWT88380.1 Inner membrane protein YgaP [Pseudobythopirellula maris]